MNGTHVPTLGVLGGSGLYAMDALEGASVHRIDTPFGPPSAEVVSGDLRGVRYLFLPRHGRGHTIPPHRVNYRANVFALKALGAQQIVSVSAVGSLRESLAPGDVVLVDQLVDRTRHRADTFFDEPGLVAHVSMADPIDGALLDALHGAALAAGARVHRGGTYVCVEGPQFSTRAESLLYRSWGMDVIGMTNLPEARLAREAELPYATVALVTDYDCWHTGHENVTVDAVLDVLKRNVALARTLLMELASRLPDPMKSPAANALETALVTDLAYVPAATRERLHLLVSKYLNRT